MNATRSNQCIRYTKHTIGPINRSHFTLTDEALAECGDGQIEVRIVYLSLDPYQRRQMMPDIAYAQPLRVGDIMVGRAIGKVTKTRHPDFNAGDWVKGHFGWQRYAVIDGNNAEKVDLDGFPPPLYLGILGSPGLTAWVGLRVIAAASPSDTIVISAATGAVGSVASALARATGCRIVGIAGGDRKCELAVRKLGYDACVDHTSAQFRENLIDVTQAGVDVDFENVGGYIFDCVLERLNNFGRVALCGMISQYNRTDPYRLRNIDSILNKNATITGFRITNYKEKYPEALAELRNLVRIDQIVRMETTIDGLENAPASFAKLFNGENLGKLLIRVSDDENC